MPAVLVLALLIAQPPKVVPTPKVEPAYTAFPDLKPPPGPWTDPVAKDDFAAAKAKYDKAMDELVWKHFLPQLPEDATPLQRLQYEQARTGQTYIKQMQALIDQGGWQPRDLKDFLTMASDMFRAAAELAPTPAARVRYYESRVILLKEFERFIELRVTTGTEPPQTLSTARYHRLQAEVDLMKLKESLKDGK